MLKSFTGIPLFLLIILLLTSSLPAASLRIANREIIFLPSKSQKIFPFLYADPFEPQLGLSKDLNRKRYTGRIGQSVFLLQFRSTDGKEQKGEKDMFLGITGYSWSLLGQEGRKFPLRAVDYLLAGYLDFNYRDFAARIKFSHISAHLGDSPVEEADETRLPITYSREFISGLLAFRSSFLTIYGGMHWIYHTIPKVKPFNFQGGFILNFGTTVKENFSPYLSMDFHTIAEFNYFINSRIQLGTRLFYQNGKAYRLAYSYYSGYSEFGQYYNLKKHYSSIGFYIDY